MFSPPAAERAQLTRLRPFATGALRAILVGLGLSCRCLNGTGRSCWSWETVGLTIHLTELLTEPRWRA